MVPVSGEMLRDELSPSGFGELVLGGWLFQSFQALGGDPRLREHAGRDGAANAVRFSVPSPFGSVKQVHVRDPADVFPRSG